MSQKKIAIFGSGIAGLSAAWFLSKDYAVTLFEREKHLGMGQKGIDIISFGQRKRIDVPIRVFSTRYYPNLYQLSKAVGITPLFLNNDSSFSTPERQTYFRYKNFVKGNFSLSYVEPKLSKLPWLLHFIPDYGKLIWDISFKDRIDQYQNKTVQEYFLKRKFSSQFTEEFMTPVFSAIATCRKTSFLQYPAPVILNLFRNFSGTKPMRRWIGGTGALEKALAKKIQRIKLGVSVSKLWQEGDKVVFVDSQMQTHKFDYGIVALQANQAAEILDPSHMDIDIKDLLQIPYEKTSMSVHTDERFMPKLKKDWAAVNYLVDKHKELPLATLWVNKSEPEFYQDKTNYFQTLNPPDDMAKEITRADFERPVVTLPSSAAVKRINDRQGKDRDRRIFFVGSYLGEKLPLLENGVSSSMIIAKKLGVKLAFPVKSLSE